METGTPVRFAKLATGSRGRNVRLTRTGAGD